MDFEKASCQPRIGRKGSWAFYARGTCPCGWRKCRLLASMGAGAAKMTAPVLYSEGSMGATLTKASVYRQTMKRPGLPNAVECRENRGPKATMCKETVK